MYIAKVNIRFKKKILYAMSASVWALWHQSISRPGIDLILRSCHSWKHWSNATLVAGVKTYKHKSNAVSDNDWMYFSIRPSADTAFSTPHAYNTDEIIDYTYLNMQTIIKIWYHFCQVDISMNHLREIHLLLTWSQYHFQSCWMEIYLSNSGCSTKYFDFVPYILSLQDL